MELGPEHVQQLIKLIEDSGWDHASIETDDLRLRLSRGSVQDAGRIFGSDGTASSPPSAPDTQVPAAQVPAAGAVGRDGAEAAPADEPAGPDASTTGDADLVDVVAPTVGTFYAAPEPGAPPFVQAGDRVEPDSTVCILEVMKLMNHVRAGVSGTIVEVHVDNAEMVEYGQRLVSVAPDAADG